MKNNLLMTSFLAIGVVALAGFLLVRTTELNSPENVQKILEEKGFTDVKVGGYNFWCAKGTPIRRYFEAVDKDGVIVEGKICQDSLISVFNTVSTKPKMK